MPASPVVATEWMSYYGLHDNFVAVCADKPHTRTPPRRDHSLVLTRILSPKLTLSTPPMPALSGITTLTPLSTQSASDHERLTDIQDPSMGDSRWGTKYHREHVDGGMHNTGAPSSGPMTAKVDLRPVRGQVMCCEKGPWAS